MRTIILATCVIAGAASVEPVLPSTPFNYANQNLPDHYKTGSVKGLDNSPEDNPITDKGATLGRVLFYDRNLSVNNTVSCASCHDQAKGFTDSNQFSEGFEGGFTARHSMGLSNARYYERENFFWDERAKTLEDQVLMPIQDPVEMGMSLDDLIPKLEALDYYPPLFKDAFGSETITEDRISKAMAQFVRSMMSYQSKFDVGLAEVGGMDNIKDDFPSYTKQENRGKDLYLRSHFECADCHEPPTFAADGVHNNGLDLDHSADPGQKDGKFKAPSLRNIGVGAPYMHDGRFAKLRDVIEFYNDGIQDNDDLSFRLTAAGGVPIKLNLSDSDIDAMVAFLETLTDTNFLTDPKFSDPFLLEGLDPIVSFVQPADGSTFGTPSHVICEVHAVSDSAIESVELLVSIDGGDEISHGILTAAPFEWALSLSEPGSYVLHARAIDDEGDLGLQSVSIQVEGGSNLAPIVEITEPTGPLPAPADLGVVVEATDPDGNVEWVDLYINGSLVRREGSAAFEWGVANKGSDDVQLLDLPVGNYQLRAIAADNDGATTITEVDISITDPDEPDPNLPPEVTIDFPKDGDTFIETDTINVAVSATDADGIDRIELKNNGSLVATLTEAPYTFSLDGIAPGSYKVKAKAFDNSGKSSTDTVDITIEVADEPGPTDQRGITLSTTDATTIYEAVLDDGTSDVIDSDGAEFNGLEIDQDHEVDIQPLTPSVDG